MNTYLIGGGNHLTNLYVVKKICIFLTKAEIKKEYNFQINNICRRQAGHDVSYGIDSSELKKELKWNPKISFDTGIEKTVNWYLDNKNWWVPLLKEKR